MFSKLSSGWTAILLLCVFGFSACDDDDVVTPPTIGTITDIAAEDDRFSTLVSALQRTGLDQTLDVASGRFTVFAPTNDAFANSGIDLDALTDEELTNVLLYHVVSGGTIYRSANIPAGVTALTSLNDAGPSDGLTLTVENSGGSITVNEANVIVADVEGVNGVIHGIDGVLLPPTIADQAVDDGRFTILVAALQRTGLDEVLAGAGDYTVFAPTDEAFTDSGIDLDDVSDEDLADLLLYHVVGTGIPAGALAEGDNFAASLSENGPDDAPLSLLVNNDGGSVTVNGTSSVVVADVFGNNGVIHAINQVLSPQSIVDFATKVETLSSLATAVTDAGLVPTLSSEGPFTVFAPTNDAFTAAAPVIATLTPGQVADVLTYHVVSGANVRSDAIPGEATTVNGETLSFSGEGNATITTTTDQSVGIDLVDVQGTNGVVHVIGTVLVPANL